MASSVARAPGARECAQPGGRLVSRVLRLTTFWKPLHEVAHHNTTAGRRLDGSVRNQTHEGFYYMPFAILAQPPPRKPFPDRRPRSSAIVTSA
jgi:hypothetical protein